MVINNFDTEEPIQICLCGHLGCGGSDMRDDCLLTENECCCENCECGECACQEEGEDEVDSN